jgi:hypothetical protein
MQLSTHTKTKVLKGVCPYCKESIKLKDLSSVRCSVCNSVHHNDCWNENKKCAIYGCSGIKAETPLRKPNWGLDLLFGIVFLTLSSWPTQRDLSFRPLNDAREAILIGAQLYFSSALLFLSYFWRDASWLLRALIWACETRGWGARTPIVLGLLLFVLGTLAIVRSLSLI